MSYWNGLEGVISTTEFSRLDGRCVGYKMDHFDQVVNELSSQKTKSFKSG